MKTRFVLEQEIMKAWNTATDLELLFDFIAEADLSRPDYSDKLSNILIGIIELHNLRCERAFNTFEELVKKGGF